MARTPEKTASILSELYEDTFSDDSYEKFRITWPDLRGIAGVSKLTPGYIHKINHSLNETGYTLIPFDNFLVVVQESDLSKTRLVPPRIVELNLYEDENNNTELDEDDERD